MTEPREKESSCVNCGEPIYLGEFDTWHHEDPDGYVVCGFGLDTEKPGELVAQWAKPND